MKGGPIASVCARRPGMVQLEKNIEVVGRKRELNITRGNQKLLDLLIGGQQRI